MGQVFSMGKPINERNLRALLQRGLERLAQYIIRAPICEVPSGIATKADLANFATMADLKAGLAEVRKDIIDLKTLMLILWAVQVLVYTGLFAGLYLLLLKAVS